MMIIIMMYRRFYKVSRGWSGGAKVLGKLPVPGRSTGWITVDKGLLCLQ